MSQAFSLYGELTVRAELSICTRACSSLAARTHIPGRIEEMVAALRPRGRSWMRCPMPCRSACASACRWPSRMIHAPEILILDEPTSGVDPVARDGLLADPVGSLAASDGVTIFVSTHFMNEAERCDRISLMHAGKVLISDTPAAIVAQRGRRHASTMPSSPISRKRSARAGAPPQPATGGSAAPPSRAAGRRPCGAPPVRSCAGCSAYARLRIAGAAARPDPLDARPGWQPCILMFVIGYGINFDVENLSFAVLDRDQSPRPAATTSLQHRRIALLHRKRPPHRRATPSWTGACGSGELSARHRDPARFRRAIIARGRPGRGRRPGSTGPCRSRAETVQRLRAGDAWRTG